MDGSIRILLTEILNYLLTTVPYDRNNIPEYIDEPYPLIIKINSLLMESANE